MVSLRQSKDTRQNEKEIFQKVKEPIDKTKKIGYTLDKVLNKYQSKEKRLSIMTKNDYLAKHTQSIIEMLNEANDILSMPFEKVEEEEKKNNLHCISTNFEQYEHIKENIAKPVYSYFYWDKIEEDIRVEFYTRETAEYVLEELKKAGY